MPQPTEVGRTLAPCVVITMLWHGLPMSGHSMPSTRASCPVSSDQPPKNRHLWSGSSHRPWRKALHDLAPLPRSCCASREGRVCRPGGKTELMVWSMPGPPHQLERPDANTSLIGRCVRILAAATFDLLASFPMPKRSAPSCAPQPASPAAINRLPFANCRIPSARSPAQRRTDVIGS